MKHHKHLAAGLLWGASVLAAQAATEGDFKLHSGYYFTGTVTPVGESRAYVNGPYWGVSFNDSGSGAFHHAAWNCPGLTEVVDGEGVTSGHCTITDGERGTAYVKWESAGSADKFGGKATFTGGSGAYQGISGAFHFSCRSIHENGRQHVCSQMGSYQLP